MDENALAEKEKKNKKVAFIITIVLFAICIIFGAVGGVASFINMVNESSEPSESMATPQVQEFSDGVLNILNGNTVLGTYKCQHSSCGYVFGFNDDNLYDLKTLEVSDYQIRKIINNRFVLLYDDDENDAGSLHRSNGVIVYDYVDSKVVKNLKAIKNYNKNDMVVFIAQDTNNKWGVIKFDKNQIVEMVKPSYDYIGAFIPVGEQLNGQSYYAAKLGVEWFIIDINKGTTYSNAFVSPIVAYDGELVVTKSGSTFDVYDVKGNKIYKGATDYNFPGGGLLVVNTSNQLVVFDAYAITKLYDRDYVQISSIVSMETENGFVVKVNDEEVYNKANKNKSARNVNGASIDMIVMN